MIGFLKPCLEQATAGRIYSYGELATVMAKAAQVVNSRPIARGKQQGPERLAQSPCGKGTLREHGIEVKCRRGRPKREAKERSSPKSS
jgi:hypothetical protein